MSEPLPAHLQVHPTRARDAQVIANRLVALLDRPSSEARAVGAGAPLEAAVEGAVVLGAGAWDAVKDVVRPYRVERGKVVLITGENGQDEVLDVPHQEQRRWGVNDPPLPYGHHLLSVESSTGRRWRGATSPWVARTRSEVRCARSRCASRGCSSRESA